MSLSGSPKQLDYEASAGWTTYGTWRATFHCFRASRRDMKAPQKMARRASSRAGLAEKHAREDARRAA